MAMIVRPVLSRMRVVVRCVRSMQSVVDMVCAMHMLVRMGVRMRVGMAVRMGVH